MKRRDVFKTGLGASALVGLAASASAQTAVSPAPQTLSPMTLRLSGPDGPSTERLAQRISAASAGRLSFDVTAVAPAEAAAQLDTVSAGEVDMALIDLHRLIDRNTAFGLFDGMPFGLSASEIDAWIFAADGRAILDDLGAAHGVKIFLAADRGAMPLWSRVPLTDMDGLLSLSIGSRGLGKRALQAIGAAQVTDLDAEEGWGNLDVLDGVGIAEMQAKGLTDAFPHVTRVNPNTPSSLTALVVAEAVFGQMDDAAQLLLQRGCTAAFTMSQASALQTNATARRELGDALTVYDLPDAIWMGLQSGAQQVLAEIFEGGPDNAAICDGFVFFLTDVARWSYIGEASFYAGRTRLNAL
ncbi:MAG: hypothetical protein AAGB05_00720 [Pseudomonadota bacterium]